MKLLITITVFFNRMEICLRRREDVMKNNAENGLVRMNIGECIELLIYIDSCVIVM